MMGRLFFIIGVCLFLVVGCSVNKNAKIAREVTQDAYDAQRPVVMQKSGKDDRPEWVRLTSYEDDGVMCFAGGFLNGSDYAVSVRCANAEALKVAVQGISQFIRVEFSGYVHASNANGDPVDRYVSDGLATFTESLHMQGVRQAEVYYEEIFSPSVMVPAYNVWVRLEMGKVDYIQAKAEAIKRLRNRLETSTQN